MDFYVAAGHRGVGCVRLSLTVTRSCLQYSQMLPPFLLCAGVIWCWAGCVTLNSEVVINGLRWEQDRRKTLQLAEENESAEELWTKAETKLSECSKFDVSEWWEYLPQTVKTERCLRALFRYVFCVVQGTTAGNKAALKVATTTDHALRCQEITAALQQLMPVALTTVRDGATATWHLRPFVPRELAGRGGSGGL